MKVIKVHASATLVFVQVQRVAVRLAASQPVRQWEAATLTMELATLIILARRQLVILSMDHTILIKGVAMKDHQTFVATQTLLTVKEKRLEIVAFAETAQAVKQVVKPHAVGLVSRQPVHTLAPQHMK